MISRNTIARRGALAAAFCLVLAGAMCPGPDQTSKEVGVAAIQDFVMNPLGGGAPLAGVVLGSADLGKETARRIYEREAVKAQAKANDAQGNPTLQAKYEAEEGLYSAAARCIATGNCDELNSIQKEMKTAALVAEGNKGGSGSSH